MMINIETILNDEVLFMRGEIANNWHLNHVFLNNDQAIKFAKNYFIAMPISDRKGRLSEDILFQAYESYIMDLANSDA